MILEQVRIGKESKPTATRPTRHLNLTTNFPLVARAIDPNHQLPARDTATQRALDLTESFIKKPRVVVHRHQPIDRSILRPTTAILKRLVIARIKIGQHTGRKNGIRLSGFKDPREIAHHLRNRLSAERIPLFA